MRSSGILKKLQGLRATGKKAVALLIDPAKPETSLNKLLVNASENDLDFFFVGSSFLSENNVSRTIQTIRNGSENIPVVLFPGNVFQLSEEADGILFLSLISGRNPELLIGQHVTAAPFLAKSDLEILPTGYMLIDGGGITSVNYVSQTLPLPNNKPDLAIATALAGTFLGLRLLYLEAGSGAPIPVATELIRGIRNHTECPIIVGGGINTLAKAKNAWNAGADLVVIGNGAEKNPDFLTEVLHFSRIYNMSLNIN